MDEEKIKTIFNDILDKKLEGIFKSFDDLKLTLETLKDANKNLKSENDSLKRRVNQLEADVDILKQNCDDQEQYIRRECLEIHGVPAMAGENTNQIVTNISSLIDVSVKPEDISVSHRLPTRKKGNKDQSSPIIVRFVRRDKREELYQKRRSLKDFSVNNIGLDHGQSNGKIYIQESLTQAKKQLFKKCIQFKKENMYKFIWTHFGTIYLRKHEKSPAHKISSQADLDRLLSAPFHPASYAHVAGCGLSPTGLAMPFGNVGMSATSYSLPPASELPSSCTNGRPSDKSS